MKKEVHFVNKLVKQGNSLCVRVPYSIIKEGNLTEDMEVLMSMMPKEEKYDYDTETINYLLEISNKVEKLSKYTVMQRKVFLMLNFEFLKFAKGRNLEEKGKEFYDLIKKDFSEKFADSFMHFEVTFNKEAFITEDDGTTILKSKYR